MVTAAAGLGNAVLAVSYLAVPVAVLVPIAGAVSSWVVRRARSAGPDLQRRLEEAEARELAAHVLADKQQAIFSAVVERSDDAITSVRLDGTVVAWNAAAERLYGYSATEVIRTLDGGFLAAGDPVDAADLLDRLSTGGKGVQFETRAPRKDGTTVDAWVTVSPVFDHAGALIGTARIARDLTGMKQAQAAQRAAEERASHAQRMASLGQLAGGVAHDFNNLLGIVLNFITFAADEAGDNEAVREDLAKAHLAAERAVGLTRQLLTFTRQDTVHAQLIDVNAAVAEAQQLLTRTIGAHITLIVTPSPVPLTIFADDGRLHQVLVNLAVNARDAMPDGGTLIIEAGAVELHDQQADVHPAPAAGRYVRFLVADTGTGMSPDTIGRIFEPFFTTKPRGHGTGLGLATVYGIIVEAGGSIAVTSEVGIGTTFQVYFPEAVDDDGSAGGAPAAEDAPRGHGETILMAEDEAALGETVARILTNGGYHVLAATGGPQALDLDAAHHCDLLLTDVVMPDMSGRQLARAWQHRHPGLPVLYMSGYPDGLLDATQAAADDLRVIAKPFTAHRLLTDVGAALRTTSPSPRRR